jgi:hypothetical protein
MQKNCHNITFQESAKNYLKIKEKKAQMFSQQIGENRQKIVTIILTPGTDVMILKTFSPKNSTKKMAFLTQNEGKLCKILIISLVFEKNAIFFSENCRKSPKIVIIILTPGHFDPTHNFD